MKKNKKRTEEHAESHTPARHLTVVMSEDEINALVGVLSFTSACLDTLTTQSIKMQDDKSIKIYASRKEICDSMCQYFLNLVDIGEPDSRALH